MVRKNLGWSYKPFLIPNNIFKEWRSIGNKGFYKEKKWLKIFNKTKIKLKKSLKNNFTNSVVRQKKDILKNLKPIASRKSSELFLENILKSENTLIGGSADLAGSNNTKTKLHRVINAKNYNGNYIHYGVREHAMSGIMNGLALHSNFIPLMVVLS